ncbi:MAG: hypothetical protein PHI86_03825 [Candidatus Omnitrophica bacterium]|nr:hypothetical protein [Candidatus Omnitrophota bacterium]HOX54867.1 hypothetical protein [Candidatus Omnitrophota bacterium]
MITEKSKKFLRGSKALRYFFLIFGLASFLASIIVPLVLVGKIETSVGKAYVKTIMKISAVNTNTELELRIKNTLLISLRKFYMYVLDSNGLFLRLYPALFFTSGVFCLSFFLIMKRYSDIIKESGIES